MLYPHKQVHIIRHLAFEDMGAFAEVLEAEGASLHYYEAGVDDLSQLSASMDELLVVLGGPISANDEADYPFLTTELALLEKRLTMDKPTLGICLGAQLMAKALGAEVYPGPRKEIGWAPIELSEAGQKSALRHLCADDSYMLHWHGETFDLPDNAIHLAASEHYYNQAFSYGQRVLALQFHPEVTAKGLEQWFIGHSSEIEHTQRLSVQRLRADTGVYAERLQQQGRAFFRAWLEQLSA